jgi:hypothetical protein
MHFENKKLIVNIRLSDFPQQICNTTLKLIWCEPDYYTSYVPFVFYFISKSF